MIAEELGMPTVVVPPMPGNFSAFGLLVADVRHDYARTRLTACADLTVGQLGAIINEMRTEACTELAAEGFAEDAMRFEARFDMRYIGQAFELSVELPDNTGSMAEVEAAFRNLYERRYSHATDEPSEIVCFRLAAFGVGAKPRLPEFSAAGRALADARVGQRRVAFNGAFMETPVYDRVKLPPEATLEGPALVEEPGTTTVVPPAFRARADRHGNLILERG
jgi:N-methylhydantoinase A